MKTSKTAEDFPLTAQSVDLISEKVGKFSESLKNERKNVLRLRLSIEELLLKWRDRFGEEATVRLHIGTRFGKPYLSLELAGEEYNPTNGNDEFEEISSKMLGNMGLFPVYQYAKGVNCITVHLKKKPANPFAGLFLAVAAAIVLGCIGMLLPTEATKTASDLLLTPICDTFLSVLNAVAGPVIFLSVAWGIYGIGDASLLGRIGKKVLLRFAGITAFAATAAAVLLIPFSDLQFASVDVDAAGFKSVLELILGIFPSDVVSPFLTGNTLQIILLAGALGCVLLLLGSQTSAVAATIEQANYIFQYLIELISRFIPGFIFIILLRLIWSDSVSAAFSAWKPLWHLLVLTLLLFFGEIGFICFKEKVSMPLFIRKIFPTFLIAFITASSSASYGESVVCCEQKLGIHQKLTKFGIPLSIVLCKPSSAINFIAYMLYFAAFYRVPISPVWIVSAIFMTVVISIALPPVAGGCIACYSILLLQLGIPTEAMGIIMVLNIVSDFICTGFNAVSRMCGLVLLADQTDMLDRDILRRK